MRKVLDGMKRLISHYVEQWMNKAVDRKEKQLEEEKSRDRVQMEQFKVCVFYNFFFKEETWIVLSFFFFLIFNLMLAFGKREGETSDLPRVQLNNVCILSFDGRDEAILVFTTCERGASLHL